VTSDSGLTTNNIAEPFNSGEMAQILTASPSPLQVQWWPNAFAWLWLTGVVAMVLYGATSYYMLSLKMRKASRVGANIYKATNINSPFVLGLFRPQIYLPPNLKPHEHEYILLHEQTHIARKDHIVKLIAYLVLALHWFNPLAWVSFLLMGKDMEMSCDERVIKKMGGKIKKDYSLTLLSMATENRVIGVSPITFGEGRISERVKNVLNFKKPSQAFVILTLVVVLVLVIGLGLNRTSVQDDGNVNTPGNEGEYVYEASDNLLIRSTPYVGAAHETSRIVSYMPIPSIGWEVQGIQIGEDHGDSGYGSYTLTVFYEPQTINVARLMWEIPMQTFYTNAAFLFEHIGNLKAVSFSVNSGQTGRVNSDIYIYRWNITHEDNASAIVKHNEMHLSIDETWTWGYHDDISNFQARRPGSFSGPIAIVGNRLYLDPVEIIFITDTERIEELWPNWVEEQTERWPDHEWSLYDKMPNGHYIRHMNVELVSSFDYERIAELGLDPETAFVDGWPYENPLPAETLSFELTPETIFEFVDSGLELPCTFPYGNRVRATSLNNFLLTRPWLADTNLAGASTFRRVPMYVQVNELGQVVRVVEEFFLTQ